MKFCNFCFKKAKKICANCKNSFYCDKICQLNDWKNHISFCFGQLIKFCLLDGETVEEINCKLYDLKFSTWYECKIPNQIGVPLYAKKNRN
jgi:hypothetical protein